MILTVKEAAGYSNIGISKTDSMLQSPNYSSVAFAGTKRLVMRKGFKEYICDKLVI